MKICKVYVNGLAMLGSLAMCTVYTNKFTIVQWKLHFISRYGYHFLLPQLHHCHLVHHGDRVLDLLLGECVRSGGAMETLRSLLEHRGLPGRVYTERKW